MKRMDYECLCVTQDQGNETEHCRNRERNSKSSNDLPKVWNKARKRELNTNSHMYYSVKLAAARDFTR
jgi:hypothetical protein